MGLYRAQLSVGPFRRGEIVEVEEDEFARYIERGWLKPYTFGDVEPSIAAMHGAINAPPTKGESEAEASTEDASSSAAAQDDAPPSDE